MWKYQAFFAMDWLDCGLTNFYIVCILMWLEVPPTYVCQYKIPISSYEPVPEVINSILKKRVSPRPAIAPTRLLYGWYSTKRKVSHYHWLQETQPTGSIVMWPMMQLDQELPVAAGFWAISVHPDNQHKLVFTFANRVLQSSISFIMRLAPVPGPEAT